MRGRYGKSRGGVEGEASKGRRRRECVEGNASFWRRPDGFAEQGFHSGIARSAGMYAVGGHSFLVETMFIGKGGVVIDEDVVVLRHERANPGVESGDEVVLRRLRG